MDTIIGGNEQRIGPKTGEQARGQRVEGSLQQDEPGWQHDNPEGVPFLAGVVPSTTARPRVSTFPAEEEPIESDIGDSLPRPVLRPVRRHPVPMNHSWIWLVVFLGMMSLYVASPSLSFSHFRSALRAGDNQALENHIDFVKVRDSLSALVAQRLDTNRGLPEARKAAVANVAEMLLAADFTPEGLREAVQGKTGSSLLGLDKSFWRNAQGLASANVSSPSFCSPVRFSVQTKGREKVTLYFAFTGLGWTLKALEVDPGSIIEQAMTSGY